jgi:hypothetical protein
VKYLVLIYSNPASREIWESFTDEQRSEGFSAYAALNEALDATGERIVSEALSDASLGKRIAIRGGQAMPTDGPFAEVKEHLAGFYLLECESFERAVEIAGQIPEADLGLVEVRPVRDLPGL